MNVLHPGLKSVQYPEIFSKVEGITKAHFAGRAIPTHQIGAGTQVMRTIVKQHDGKINTALEARNIYNAEGDFRWNGMIPGGSNRSKLTASLYLSEGLSSLGNEAIAYYVKEKRRVPQGSLNATTSREKEENIFSRSLGAKVVFAFQTQLTKRCINLSPVNNEFMRSLCVKLDSDKDISDIVKRLGYKDAQSCMFKGDDYSLSRAVGTALLSDEGVDGLWVPTARDYLLNENWNLLMKNEKDFGQAAVVSLMPKQRVILIPNMSIEGADNIVVTDLDPVTGVPRPKK